MMRAVLQRVRSARVQGRETSEQEIAYGMVVLIGFHEGDTSDQVRRLIDKIYDLRIFEDAQGKMNRSVVSCGGDVLIVPNFTLAASLERGRRPSFDTALNPQEAKQLFHECVAYAAEKSCTVKAGTFGDEMHVELCNDGPVTFIIDEIC